MDIYIYTYISIYTHIGNKPGNGKEKRVLSRTLSLIILLKEALPD